MKVHIDRLLALSACINSRFNNLIVIVMVKRDFFSVLLDDEFLIELFSFIFDGGVPI